MDLTTLYSASAKIVAKQMDSSKGRVRPLTNVGFGENAFLATAPYITEC